MSASKWAYDPEICDGTPCPGECDKCTRWQVDEETDDVTYCRDCEYCTETDRGGMCIRFNAGMLVADNDYCSFGEEREHE